MARRGAECKGGRGAGVVVGGINPQGAFGATPPKPREDQYLEVKAFNFKGTYAGHSDAHNGTHHSLGTPLYPPLATQSKAGRRSTPLRGYQCAALTAGPRSR